MDFDLLFIFPFPKSYIYIEETLAHAGLACKVELKSVRVHFAYGSDGRSFFVEYS